MRRNFSPISPNLPEKILCAKHSMKIKKRHEEQSKVFTLTHRVPTFWKKSQIQTYSIQSHLKVPKHLCPNFLRFVPNFQGFCPDFRQIKNFGGALSPPAPPNLTPLHPSTGYFRQAMDEDQGSWSPWLQLNLNQIASFHDIQNTSRFEIRL